MLHNIRINERLLRDEDFEDNDPDNDQLNNDRIPANVNALRQLYINNNFAWMVFVNKLLACLLF